MKRARSINQKLLHIIQNEFDGCEWFIISANELMKIINDMIETFKNDGDKSFEEIRDSIGSIGIAVSNVEKCLDAVEECYGKLVETLHNEVKKNT